MLGGAVPDPKRAVAENNAPLLARDLAPERFGRASTCVVGTSTPARSGKNSWPSAKLTVAPTSPTMRSTPGDSDDHFADVHPPER